MNDVVILVVGFAVGWGCAHLAFIRLYRAKPNAVLNWLDKFQGDT